MHACMHARTHARTLTQTSTERLLLKVDLHLYTIDNSNNYLRTTYHTERNITYHTSQGLRQNCLRSRCRSHTAISVEYSVCWHSGSHLCIYRLAQTFYQAEDTITAHIVSHKIIITKQCNVKQGRSTDKNVYVFNALCKFIF